MKITLIVFFLTLSFGLICGEDKAKEPENVICKKCNCDAAMKTIECSNKGLTKMFTLDDWVALNSTKDSYEILKLDHNQLDAIDVAFPPLKFPLKVIDFSHNKIKTIVNKLFYELSYIQEVDLSFNLLTTEKLRPDVFEGKYNGDEYEPIKSLRKLKLSYNLLHNLDSEVFEHVKHLQELYLDNNPFQIIHTNVLNAFSDIPLLQKLDMSRMELTELPMDTFHPLKALRVLKLQENLFRTIPQALIRATNLRELSLDENPIGDLNEQNAMPKLLKLEKLNMTFMGSLHVIGRGSLSGLESLTELRLSNNHHLAYIHPDAFKFPEKDNPERPQWPLITKLFLEYNNLTGLDNNLFGNWKKMEEIHIHDNPWLCDCELQWVNNILMPIIREHSPHLIEHIQCAAPHPLAGEKLLDLSEENSEMRCLDKYGAHPERDSALLVALLIGVLLGMPLAFASIMVFKRVFGRQGPAEYSRAFYKRADMQDDHI